MELVILVYMTISIMAGYAIVRGGKILITLGVILLIVSLSSNPTIMAFNVIGYIMGAIIAYLIKKKASKNN
ncbi:hypothetical protein [Candidatus Sulfurimonas baltica]|uniref:Uncharacterized protein n=1 Tax=Candidatus Sulfurimonas baltica TaxID=2740404 RepID=A0A7S7RM04_9BACT|nr:hypothetical protein [Candidatus Sulfurimonas baltica]QOY50996.1 hypothetical protein HUE88_07535 [Candidatus Sulfurimonas baltica]